MTTKFTEQDHARLATLFEGAVYEPDRASKWRPCVVCGGFAMKYGQPCGGGCTAGRMPDREPYPGYKPTVREAPNGDTKACPDMWCKGGWSRAPDGSIVGRCRVCDGTGRVPNVDAEGDCPKCWGGGLLGDDSEGHAVDCDACAGSGRAPAKRWLHVAPKYNPPAWAAEYYDRAFAEACRVATALGVPAAYRPHEAYCALRVLEYPPSAGTVEHTDPDLFTIVLWRSTPDDLVRADAYEEGGNGVYPERLDTVSPGLHIGKIGELVGLGPATPHHVPARPYAQRSIVFFAIPDHAEFLPGREGLPGLCTCPNIASEFYPDRREGCAIHGPRETVGEWLDRELAKMRVTAGAYT